MKKYIMKGYVRILAVLLAVVLMFSSMPNNLVYALGNDNVTENELVALDYDADIPAESSQTENDDAENGTVIGGGNSGKNETESETADETETQDETTEEEQDVSDSGIQIIADTTESPVTWGDLDTVPPTTVDDIRTWNLTDTTNRYVDIFVKITVSSNEKVTITLNRYIEENVRGDFNDFTKAEINTATAPNYCTVNQSEDSVSFTFQALGETGQHRTFQLPYHFDCWGVKSNEPFSINYTIEIGEDAGSKRTESGVLTGKIITDFNFDFDSYFDGGGGSGYSLNAFGGADKYMSYIQNWSSVYEKYFGFTEDAYNENTDEYIYDVVPFFVKPTGQHPYDISGKVTLDNGGEVLGGVYMMDSYLGSAEVWKKLTLDDENNFSFSHDENFEDPNSGISLIDKVVTGNLTDPVHNSHYTLYFLVRYKKSELTEEPVNDATYWTHKTAYTTKAKLYLTHTDIDSPDKSISREWEQIAYQGPITESRIYDAYYTYFLTNQQDALSNLNRGLNAAIDYKADFLCYNEARDNFNKKDPDKYRLEAVIDLLYFTGDTKEDDTPPIGCRPYAESPRLNDAEYRFSQFGLSLVDAPGNWSQNWHYENKEPLNEVWKDNRSNIGWPEETWQKWQAGQSPEDLGYGPVIVYGNQSLDGGEWEEIKRFDVNEIWAKDHGRGINRTWHIDEGKNYVRLKVVYDSRWTTALSVSYQIELLPTILETYPTLKKDVQQQGLTSWLNYFGYKKDSASAGEKDSEWSADTSNMDCDRYPHFDGDWNTDDRGTVEQARQYDKAQSEKTEFKDKYNLSDQDGDRDYSMRDFIRIILGRMDDQAGMLITQALYDSGRIVGNNVNSIEPESGSFCEQKEVTDVSEIVYSISGGITNGALTIDSLKKRREENEPNSPFKSLKMRYYVLLPEGFELNREPSSPRYHYAESNFLSAMPTFYEDRDKTIGKNTVPISDSNIPAWEKIARNDKISQMYWAVAGNVVVNDNLSSGQLVVFDRTLEDEDFGEVFNLYGATQTYMWGRGLSFSIKPKDGIGTIPTSDFTTNVWCQYLGESEQPLSLENFNKNVSNVEAEKLNSSLPSGEKPIEEDTLLYIPSTFHNTSPAGTTEASITLESNYQDKDGNPVVQFDKEYAYRLQYKVNTRTSNNVVLWTNIEQEIADKPYYQGTVTGVDLSDLPENVRQQVKVYVKTEYFNPDDYVSKNRDSEWLTGESDWQLIDINSYQDWASVKAVAFFFEGVEFNANGGEEAIGSATVKIKMKAPKQEGKYLEFDGMSEKTFYAESPLIFSDSHYGKNGLENACTPANKAPVNITVWFSTLPETGGMGTTVYTTVGLMLCMGGTVIYLWEERRKFRHGNGKPYRM